MMSLTPASLLVWDHPHKQAIFTRDSPSYMDVRRIPSTQSFKATLPHW